MNWQIVCADVLDWSASYDGPKFHAMLCDPPYELGFMSRDWDKSGIAFQPETWAALAQHLHPGAWIMAFASSRGWHRLAVAMEDSGLIIQPSIFCWAQGQGFCKATNIHAQLEKQLCYKDENKDWFYQEDDKPINNKPPFRHPLAERFYGHRYGGQVLAPKVEPIICAQKPWQGKRLDCIVETGAGALWVDGARIAADGEVIEATGETGFCDSHEGYKRKNRSMYNIKPKERSGPANPSGRWPPNLVLQHDPGCQRVGVRKVKSNERPNCKGKTYSGARVYGGFAHIDYEVRRTNPDGTETVADYRCTESCPVRRLGEQSGESGPTGRKAKKHSVKIGMYEGGDKTCNDYIDTGTAARFFQQSDWSYEIAERLALADPVRYQAKASRAEREGGLFGVIPCAQCGGLDTEIHVNEHGRTVTCRRCDHPTVKPLSLNIWLATLLLPPSEYAPRRLLVPFAGTGSEGIGGLLAGWDEVVMVDNNAEYCQIAEARTKWWAGWSKQADTTEPKDILKASNSQPKPDDGQLELL